MARVFLGLGGVGGESTPAERTGSGASNNQQAAHFGDLFMPMLPAALE